MLGAKYFLAWTWLVDCGIYPLNKVYEVLAEDVLNFLLLLHLLDSFQIFRILLAFSCAFLF